MKLEVGPVIHRVADCHLKSFCELDELVIRICVAGYEIFRNAVGAHDAPFVMVTEIGAVCGAAAQPYFRDVVVAAIFVDLPRRNVAMVIDDRHLFRVCVEDVTRGLILQHEVFTHEWLHNDPPLYVKIIDLIGSCSGNTR